MKKKWITQAEINKILNTYSSRKGEFLPVEGKEYFYQSQIIKGYTISISEESEQGVNYSAKTGRIIVTHSQWNGRKTLNDIWERDKDGILQFKFRNLWNQPTSDAQYISDLEQQIEELTKAGHQLQEQLRATDTVQKYQKLIIDNAEYDNSIAELQEQINLLKQENQKLIIDTKHNARGAGRKPSKERIDAIAQMQRLLKSGVSEQDIMLQLGISKPTFYRYKKSINN